MLPSLAQVGRRKGGSCSNTGADYDKTLLAWGGTSAGHGRVSGALWERFGRMWRFYLLSCAGAFRARSNDLFQFVFSKGGVPGGYVAVL